MVDAECGVLGLEWIEGRSVRILLGGGDEAMYEDDKKTGNGEGEEVHDKLIAFGVTIGVCLSSVPSLVHGCTDYVLRRRGGDATDRCRDRQDAPRRCDSR